MLNESALLLSAFYLCLMADRILSCNCLPVPSCTVLYCSIFSGCVLCITGELTLGRLCILY